MNMFGISDKSYQLLQQYFFTHKNINKVIIFGSRALETYRHGSDIDFAIWGADLNEIEIKMDLENLSTPYMYDVIDYNKLDNENLQKHIDSQGKIFFERK